MRRILLRLSLVVLVLLACNISMPLGPVAPAPATDRPATATAGPAPTNTNIPVPTQAPTATTSPPAAPTLFPTPAADLQDLSPYQADLRPAFGADAQSVPQAPRYFIQVKLVPGQPPTMAGVERVRFTNVQTVTLDSLYFRLYPNIPGYGGSMTIGRVVLNGNPVQTRLEAQGTALRVPLDPPLAPGAVADLSLEFNDTVPTDTSSGYAVFAFADGVYALAGFYPTIPVYDAQGWNIEVPPAYGDVTYTPVSFYQVHLTAPADQVVATSGSIVQTKDNGDGTRTWVAEAGPMRDFYIAMSADYQVASQTVDGTQVNSYYRSAQAEGGKLALQYAVDALRVYSQDFGPYPYTQLDVIATPTTAGGIEYPGAIVIAQKLYERPGGFFEVATAHEVGHQWWYGMVGSNQIDEPWLDESLTSYTEYIYYQAVEGQSDADVVKRQVFEAPYQQAVEDGRDRAVAGPVASFSARDYGAIVYGKGPLFFDAVRTRIGDQAFFAALRAYLTAHRYGIAHANDLIQAFDNASPQKIDDLYNFWILDKK
jgi:hypothetical protein